jgi:hypothetical protein
LVSSKPLTGAARRGERVALHRRQVHHVLAEEIIGNEDAAGEHFVKCVQSRLWPVFQPLHVRWFEVVKHRHLITFDQRQVVIEVFTLRRIGHDALALNEGYVGEPAVAQRDQRALELPGRGVRGGERVVPGELLAHDRGPGSVQRRPKASQLTQAPNVAEDSFRSHLQDRDFGLGHRGAR